MLQDTLNRASKVISQFAAKQLPPNRLSGQDTLFLHLDQAHAATHGSVIYLYDQSTVPGKKIHFQDVLRHVETRLSSSPLFRNRIERVVGDLGYPYWVEDENFDIDFHVRHYALPKPCDWRQFCILATRVHARSLDMNRPLWEMNVIEGLDNVAGLPKGSFAIITKLHHAAVDGTALAELTWALHDTLGTKSQKIPVPTQDAPPLTYYQADTSWRQTLARIATDNLLSISQLLPPVARVTPKFSAMATAAFRQRMFPAPDAVKGPNMPITRFNKKFNAKRVFDTVEMDMADIKLIRTAVPGATVNDVVLSVVGGGLRRYLEAKGELPKTSLMAAAPINTRQDTSERKTSGNSISVMGLPVGTQIADPLKRLEYVLSATTKTKVVSSGVGAREMTDISKHTPPATLALAGRIVISSLSSSPKFNCIVSNVPGPVEPLYMMGAKLVYWSGVMPIPDGVGLFFAVSSYCGKLFISLTSSPVLVPDPEFMATCLRESIAETFGAAQKHLTAGVKRTTPKVTVVKKKSASKRGTSTIQRRRVPSTN